MTNTPQPVRVETTDIDLQWDRLCQKNPIARRIRGVRQFLFFLMWSLLLIACGLVVAAITTEQQGFIGGAVVGVGLVVAAITTEQQGFIGGAVVGVGLAIGLYVVATILGGQIETLRLLTELWG